jgi:hypothetical protein
MRNKVSQDRHLVLANADNAIQHAELQTSNELAKLVHRLMKGRGNFCCQPKGSLSIDPRIVVTCYDMKYFCISGARNNVR